MPDRVWLLILFPLSQAASPGILKFLDMHHSGISDSVKMPFKVVILNYYSIIHV